MAVSKPDRHFPLLSQGCSEASCELGRNFGAIIAPRRMQTLHITEEDSLSPGHLGFSASTPPQSPEPHGALPPQLRPEN